MDLDMHFYGTFAIARLAGLGRTTAETIATGAAYVDDSDGNARIGHDSGARFREETTAHHPTAFDANNDLNDQIDVWVPFHFLPGGEGTHLSNRLICRKDSALAREMVARHLGRATEPFAVELMGVLAHVYCDTFAHYGFSGISSRRNRVVGTSFQILNPEVEAHSLFSTKIQSFFTRFGAQGGLLANVNSRLMAIVSAGAEVATGLSGHGALGHGAVATFPDQPYLRWRYTYERPDLHEASWEHGLGVVERNNADDFLEGARALHGALVTFAERRRDLAEPAAFRPFDAVEERVRALTILVGDRTARIGAWQQALRDGALAGLAEEMPSYAPEPWRREMQGLVQIDDPKNARTLAAYRFQWAAADHRHYVLRELLPAHGIVLV